MGCSFHASNPLIFFLIILLVLFLFTSYHSPAQNISFKIVKIDTIIKFPSSIIATPDDDFFILSTQENVIIKLDKSGFLIKQIGGKGWGNLNFDKPTSFFTNDGLNIYVTDLYNNRIQRFNKNLDYLNSFSFDNFVSNIKYPSLIGIDKFSNLIVFDTENKRFYKYSKETKLETTFGELEFSDLQSSYPKKIAFDSKNNIYILTDYSIYVYSNWGFLLKEIKFDKFISSFFIFDDRLFLWVNDDLMEYIRENNIIKYDLEDFKYISKNFRDISINNKNVFILTDEAIVIFPKDKVLSWKRK